ncbi:hypothetical protein TUSAK1_03050 [Klebsiella variicola]|nr:hypothetical protein NUBL22018_27110 [Klebsiella variicola]GKI55713.1 hypothetical protein NUKP6_03880 [Klebsiella variicola]GKJ01006.1 hypothetical protein NUKP23_04590 [Klebsiella variicola]GKK32711.1 hypothetical protein NUKP39_24520 [Klebsiella variicola]GKM39712.1 hypothetical protein NUKP66_35980 [Klebsiella variicola]
MKCGARWARCLTKNAKEPAGLWFADSASVSAIARHQDAYDAGCLLPGGSALARAYDFTATV